MVVLGILALLTIMAVSFVFATRMSMRASEAYMRTVTATDVAEAGMAAAIYLLEADKIQRTGDALDASVEVTETHDSLRDIWRQAFSAPVIITCEQTIAGPIASGDTLWNVTRGNKARVISVDSSGTPTFVLSIADIGVEIDSTSTSLWRAGHTIENDVSTFRATITSARKSDEVDLDDDGTNDAVWHNYYDESGVLLGRYAVLIQDESSKINVNVAGNIAQTWAGGDIYSASSSNYSHAFHEGWSTYEIDIAGGLFNSGGGTEARQIVLYRNGLSGGGPWDISSSYLTPANNRIDSNRVVVAGQGDLRGDDSDSIDEDNDGSTDEADEGLDDDDDNFNRVFYRYDGVDNDGDGTIDEWDEGINEPEEFSPLRPVRLRPEVGGTANPLEYDGVDNDGDGLTDEANEGDDQPILTLEQLTDSGGAALSGDFLTATVTTNFDAATDTSIERRHLMSTLSSDRNLNKDGGLRTNLNVAAPEQDAATMRTVYPATKTGDTDAYERPDLRNMQAAVNIYDFRDRNNARTEIKDTAGNIFAGVEAVRINEVMVRAATSVYEAENGAVGSGASSDLWDTATNYGLTPTDQGAKSPLPDGGFLTWDYLMNDGTDPGETPGGDEASSSFTIVLPNPPFLRDETGDPYYFKLRMRVRSDGQEDYTADRGFEVVLNSTTYPNGTNPAFDMYGNQTSTSRCATANVGTTVYNWYIEEIFVPLYGGGYPNTLSFFKPGVTSGYTDVDTVDIDWFYFSQEPDCEWFELVNIGNETVDLSGWKIVSEYVKDISQTAAPVYYRETYELTLPSYGIVPVDSVVPSAPPPPQYLVFVVDRDDYTGSSSETIGNDISFFDTWTEVADVSSTLAAYNVYQLTSIANIYSASVDFFGNEPFDDNNDTTGPAGDRNTYSHVDVGTVSLYDANGNLVDRITYDWEDVREGFRSLQREHPSKQGERLDSGQEFKLQAFTGTTWFELQDYAVLSDGNYDDWQFPWDPWYPWSSDPTDPAPSYRYLWLWSTPTEANNLSAGGEETDYSDYDDEQRRVAMPEGRVKNRFYSNVGQLTSVPFYNEYVAIIGYGEGEGATNDEDLAPGLSVIRNTTKDPDQYAVLMSIHTGTGGSNAPGGWMVVKGNYDNPVNRWEKGDQIDSPTDESEFPFQNAEIYFVKPAATLLGDQIDFSVEIGYELVGASSDPADDDTITNTSKDPDQTATATEVDPANKIIQIEMIIDIDDPVTEWKIGETITYPGPGSATITSVRRKSADVRGLADYFTTSMIDLEARAGESTESRVNWPNADDPGVYLVSPTDSFTVTWDEDDGVQAGTYDLYSFVNYGTSMESEVPVYVGPITATKDPTTQRYTIRVTIDNAAAAAKQYYFMRAALVPEPQTFGRINVNTASRQVLQGLRLMLPDPDDSSQEASNSPARAEYADAIIRARNIEAFKSIGDLYRVSGLLVGTSPNDFYAFTPEVFSNISSLITTRSDVYKIIVLGQGAVDENGDGIIQDAEVTSQKKLEMIYQR
ncbi:MAG: hypothetical protein C4532_06570 [Candidatus Abyssobacteria bacterium SURF_17]|uniref:LTD domain-containing protein n=1 Tax=Candidatus Abyssobacteria bacterium SURF_17 TaxID=2093361 RepID=A0A419F1L3_9BACT|nr:MAG: hypothetical protein C4532_06570 [Candidatus Abyssubacteria bacterium SURF_17]